MIATRSSLAAAMVAAALVIAAGTAEAQGTSGKSCQFHPKNGAAPITVANGDTYTPAIQGSQERHMTPQKWQCQNGKLVKVE
jgi:hypothetical protein